MKRAGSVWMGAVILSAAIVMRSGLVTAQAQKPAAAAPTVAEFNELIEAYCVDCHNDQLKRGSISLDGFDVADRKSVV